MIPFGDPKRAYISSTLVWGIVGSNQKWYCIFDDDDDDGDGDDDDDDERWEMMRDEWHLILWFRCIDKAVFLFFGVAPLKNNIFEFWSMKSDFPYASSSLFTSIIGWDTPDYTTEN